MYPLKNLSPGIRSPEGTFLVTTYHTFLILFFFLVPYLLIITLPYVNKSKFGHYLFVTG